MISEPVFFPRDDWVVDHADWHPRIQGGKTIDVSRGDGERIRAECLGAHGATAARRHLLCSC